MSCKILCPNCHRILGDTDRSLDCNFNCRGCKKTVKIKLKVANYRDYIKYNAKKEARWKNHSQEV